MMKQLTKKKRNSFSVFPFRPAFLASVGVGCMLAGSSAFAQDVSTAATTNTPTTASADSSTPVTNSAPERVVVTGSLIPTAAEVTAAPLDTVDRAVADRVGSSDPLTVLERANPAFTGNGNLGATNASISSIQPMVDLQLASTIYRHLFF